METLVQIPIVMHFCNLSSCSLVHSYHLEMSYRENFPLFLLTYLLLRFFFFLLFHWISHINCFLSLSRYFKTCPQRFLVGSFSSRGHVLPQILLVSAPILSTFHINFYQAALYAWKKLSINVCKATSLFLITFLFKLTFPFVHFLGFFSSVKVKIYHKELSSCCAKVAICNYAPIGFPNPVF